jgi:methionine synthase II (cobalamin-independent)
MKNSIQCKLKLDKLTCRDLELIGKMAIKRHPFFSDASVKRTPTTQKVAGSVPGECDLGM